ncbi:MAG: endonuclease/exonuclease/phosphatase family protein [Planctomycetes bacterium]|nr:endonuclease/exonuclease/phosphatase family protein [Planctomycetota bacterium]
MRLRALSYNVHKCIGGVDRRYEPERIVETVAHHRPDLCLLQEVANTAGRKDWHRQVDLLGERLGFRHRAWFANHRFRRGGEYGNAILSRWPIASTENIDLTVPGTKRRSVLHARIRVRTPAGRSRTLHVFCLHLGLTERIRDLQMARFLASHPFAGLHAESPILVAGDFNDVWASLGTKHLGRAGFRGSARPPKTFPAWAPLRALDSIWVRGELQLLEVGPSRLPLARRASDHLPLIAELHLPR